MNLPVFRYRMFGLILHLFKAVPLKMRIILHKNQKHFLKEL